MSVLIGCIADDFTGATDLAGTLTRAGMRTVQTVGVPALHQAMDGIDAVVVALKSRTIPADEAIRQSIEALHWLNAVGCRQYLFKYCSTFDSTDAGNIGPVTEALMDVLDTEFTIACPAFPRNGRLVFKGYLFVGDGLLNEGGMQDHPLTPMNDPSLVRVLGRQSKGSIGLVDYRDIARGANAIESAFNRLRSEGQKIAIVDTLFDSDFNNIALAANNLILITGGSGIAAGLAENFRRQGLLDKITHEAGFASTDGFELVLAGSCSRTTQMQVAWAAQYYPIIKLDPLKIASGQQSIVDIVEWAQEHMENKPVLIYSTDDTETLVQVQKVLGREQAGKIIEDVMSALAVKLVESGVRRLVVAGGETSGAVVKALGISALRIAQEIDPGVPWTQTLEEPIIQLALKSGNFGSEDFFVKAFEQ